MATSKIREQDLSDDFLLSGDKIAADSIPFTAIKGNVASTEYVQEQIAGVTADGIPKLVTIPLEITATSDGQTEFVIDMETFDVNTDTVLVIDGRGLLTPTVDYTVTETSVVLNEGWNSGDTGALLVLKNVPMGEDGTVSGTVIADGSITDGKLATKYLPLDGSKSMTGTIKSENKNGYSAIDKVRTVNETDYMVRYALGSISNEAAASVELTDTTGGTSYGRLDVFGDRVTFSSNGGSRKALYGEHNKPTPADIGALNLSPIVLTGENNILELRTGFYHCEGLDEETMLAMGFPHQTWKAQVRVEGFWNAYPTQGYVRVWFNDLSNHRTYYNDLHWETWHGWQEIPSSKRNVINIADERAYISASNDYGYARIGIYDEPGVDENRRYLNIINATHMTNASSALSLVDVVDGTEYWYGVYHSGNVTAGTTDLTAGTSALITDCIYQVYE